MEVKSLIHTDDGSSVYKFNFEKDTIKKANSIARKHGFGTATDIVFGDEDKIVEHIHFGYRKYTTGEYVSKAYRRNFGWKNTYYQSAKTVVQLKEK